MLRSQCLYAKIVTSMTGGQKKCRVKPGKKTDWNLSCGSERDQSPDNYEYREDFQKYQEQL